MWSNFIPLLQLEEGCPKGGVVGERNSLILLFIGILLFYLPPPPAGTPPPPTPPLSGESNSREEENLRYFSLSFSLR